MESLQRMLLRSGQWVPGKALEDPDDLTQSARIEASSRFRLGSLPPDGPPRPLREPFALLVPLPSGPAPRISFHVQARSDTELRVELRVCQRLGHYTPDRTLAVETLSVKGGEAAWYDAGFRATLEEGQYCFVCLMENPDVSVVCSQTRLTGVLSLVHPTMSRSAGQVERHDLGFEGFEIWRPERRPWGHLPACRIEPALDSFNSVLVANGYDRPWRGPNAWVSDLSDPVPELRLMWARPQAIGRVELCFDTDFDHPMESLQYGHPEHAMPFCMRQYRLLDGTATEIHAAEDNHQTRNIVKFANPVLTDRLVLQVKHPSEHVPASLFSFRCYGDA